MTSAKQTTLFSFDAVPVSKGPVWLEDFDGNRRSICRMDAEAMVEDLNRMPSGKGSWSRCLEVDHSRSYETQFKDWDACIWFHRGIGMKKMVRPNGDVMDCMDPHPYRWHYLNGKQIHDWVYEPLKEAWIEGDVLHIRLDSGEYLAEIRSNDTIDRYDLHPYDPTTDLEHFAIECYKHQLPREMMAWRQEYVYGTPALSPFSRNISVEDAKRIDSMGNIRGSMIPNAQFNQICECAELMGIRLQLSYDIPALENPAIYPVEENCSTCLRRNKSNGQNPDCGNAEQQICCSRYMWDRRIPAKRYVKEKYSDHNDS